MQSAHLGDNLVPRTKIKMIGVVEYEVEPQLFQIMRIDPLDGPQRPDRHKGRRLNQTMGRAEPSRPRTRMPICLPD